VRARNGYYTTLSHQRALTPARSRYVNGVAVSKLQNHVAKLSRSAPMLCDFQSSEIPCPSALLKFQFLRWEHMHARLFFWRSQSCATTAEMRFSARLDSNYTFLRG
jgi:hypothetical protein